MPTGTHEPASVIRDDEAAAIPAVLDELTGGDADIVAEVVGHLIAANQSDLAALGRALDAQDWPALAAAGHSIKGAARMIRLHTVVALCERIEVAASAGDDVAATVLVPQLAASLVALETVLSRPGK